MTAAGNERRRYNLTLPSSDAAALRELHEHCRTHVRGLHDLHCDLLDAYIYKLHEAGWTLQCIADAIGVSRERVRQREAEATQEAYDSIGEVNRPRRNRPQPRKPRGPKLRPEFVEWLREKQSVATQTRGWHDLDAPERQASEELWAAINAANEQGVRLSDIARAIGMEYRTLLSGLRRHGYKKLPPSQKAYERKVLTLAGPPVTHCVHGHEFTPENTYITKAGHRQCRACDRRRGRERNERIKAAQLATVTELSNRRRSA